MIPTELILDLLREGYHHKDYVDWCPPCTKPSSSTVLNPLPTHVILQKVEGCDLGQEGSQ